MVAKPHRLDEVPIGYLFDRGGFQDPPLRQTVLNLVRDSKREMPILIAFGSV